jgi:hypothetical protein
MTTFLWACGLILVVCCAVEHYRSPWYSLRCPLCRAEGVESDGRVVCKECGQKWRLE